jgi:hypothetical protein
MFIADRGVKIKREQSSLSTLWYGVIQPQTRAKLGSSVVLYRGGFRAKMIKRSEIEPSVDLRGQMFRSKRQMPESKLKISCAAG